MKKSLKHKCKGRWGKGWQSELARFYGRHLRTVQKWVAKEVTTPKDLEQKIDEEIRKHILYLQSLVSKS